jgi:hypothetical protein
MKIRVIRVKSHSVFTLSFSLLSPIIPLLPWYPQSKEILLSQDENAETQHLTHKV